MMGVSIYWRVSRRRRHRVDQCVPLKVFAKGENVHPDTVRYWLSIGRVVGFKTAGRWFVRSPGAGDP